MCKTHNFVSLLLVALGFLNISQIHGQGANWRQAALNQHNKYRTKHSVASLALGNEVNASAQKCADYLASKKIMQHVCRDKFGHKYGENLASGSGLGAAEQASVQSTDMWYSEEPKHDYNNNNFQYASGHFSQLVWKNSKQLGIGYATNGNFKVVVAHYDPAGNVQGQFIANVLRPKK